MSELFETFDDAGHPTGLAERAIVHGSGLWHKSAHVFLFNGEGKLYVQQRALGKDLYPGLWDYSVGEHLKPGESFLDAAERGLWEELGITGVNLSPLGGLRRATHRMDELGVLDREMQQAFRGHYHGTLHPDPTEVAAVRAVAMAELARWIDRATAAFTPWFLADLNELGPLLES